MRIAVVGAGSIGSAFAFQLARVGGHEVTVVARPGSGRLGQLRRDGGIVNTKGERAEVQVADALDEAVAYDLVVVTVLAHQVDAVLPGLERSAAGWVQFMFNNFDPERLERAMAGRCSFGMVFVQASLDAEGRLEAKIGAGGQKSKMGEERWVKVFGEAGLPAVFEPKMLLWLRCHAPMCVAFESVSVAGVRRGGGATWGEAMVLGRGLRECFTLIERMGYPLYPGGKALLKGSPVWASAGMLWGMSRIRSFRELLATGAGECRALVGVLAAAAEGTGVDVGRIAAMRPE